MAKPSNLIVNYLPQNMTERDLYTMFVTIGPIQSCRVMKDFKTGYSYGFGFVTYSRPEDAETAIRHLNGTEMLNKRIKVSYARPPGEDIKETNLYVTNLPKYYNEDDLETMFAPYGNIVQKNLLQDKITGMPRGVAFVRFDRREEAQAAISGLDGQVPSGGHEKLIVKVAEEHGKQKAAYYAGLQAGLQRGGSARGGRGFGVRGAVSTTSGRGMGMRGGRISNNTNFLTNSVSYPIRTNVGFGAVRQEKLQQRYNPIAFGFYNSST